METSPLKLITVYVMQVFTFPDNSYSGGLTTTRIMGRFAKETGTK